MTWRTRLVPLLAVAAFLAAAMVAAVFANPTIPTLSAEPGSDRRAPDITPASRPPESGRAEGPLLSSPIVPDWLTWGVALTCAAATAVVVALMVWLLVREGLGERRDTIHHEPAAEPSADVRHEVRAAVDEGLAELDDGDSDPRRAVIACWVRLEAAAAAAGIPRRAGETSSELVTRLLAAHRVSATVLAGLAAIYREARFATHAVDERTRDDARAALRLVRDELAGPQRPAAGSAGRAGAR